MGSYVEIDENNIVIRGIAADQEFIDSGAVGDPSRWLQTSYNTSGGKHLLGGTPFRKNYAGVGYYYDAQRDAFIPPKPWNSWILNEETCLWEPPVPYPTNDPDKFYYWDELSKTWSADPT